jgi:hypothetical protein
MLAYRGPMCRRRLRAVRGCAFLSRLLPQAKQRHPCLTEASTCPVIFVPGERSRRKSNRRGVERLPQTNTNCALRPPLAVLLLLLALLCPRFVPAHKRTSFFRLS